SLMTSSARLFFRLNNDSLSKIGHYVILGADGSLNKSIYNDVPSSLYDTSYFSLTTTNDTTRFNRLSPALSYNLVAHNISFEVGGKMDYMRWYMHDTDRVFNVYKDYAIDSSIWATPDTMMAYRSFTALQRFAWNKKDSTLELRQHTSYIVSGKNKGDYQAAVSLNYKIKFLQTSFALHVNTELRSPDLFYAFNRVNNAYWKNDFEKSASNTIQFEARSQKLQLQLGAVHRNINKMIFLAGNQQPVQTKGAVNVTRLYVKHHLKLFKFHLENCINYQLAEQYPLPMPSLYTQHQLYFEQRVKKNGLRFQIGVQANYAGEMELVSYNPALNSFYVPDVKNKGGNYVFADFFVNVYFKPVRFFFKLEHANQGFSGMNYTLLNNYYQPDRMFHLGINWEFWD
ncbi:MAG TPA: putative porin, partial [Bacteroidia bacterium]